jgi:HEAT repeat protein
MKGATMKKTKSDVVNKLDEIIARLKGNELSISEIRQLVNHNSILVRANAMEALSRHGSQQPECIVDLVNAALDPKNSTRLVGAKVSHMAVVSLLKIGTDEAKVEASRLINDWAEPDRSDLLWFLKAEAVFEDDLL